VTDPALLALRGDLVVVGKSPDGDSVRFRPDSPELLEELRRGFRVEPSEEDGTVQLRLDGIDSPETGYQGRAQPLGRSAGDALLERCGFREVEREGNEVVAATPERRPATILSQLTDPYGRPVALLLAGETARPEDGAWVPVDAALLARTVNAAQLADGAAYLTLYDSTPAPLRRRLRAVAEEARAERRGVWARDESSGFILREQDDLGPGGALVLPKLFRRCVQYLETRRRGETLPRWLRRRERAGEPVNDVAVVAGQGERELAELVEQDGDRIALLPDLLALTFVEETE
jgi:endonuclease YncB( thermonuclease family)